MVKLAAFPKCYMDELCVTRNRPANERRCAIQSDEIDRSSAGGLEVTLKVELRGQRQVRIARDDADVQIAVGVRRAAGA